MAKSKNASHHNQNRKNHRNGIFKPKRNKFVSRRGFPYCILSNMEEVIRRKLLADGEGTNDDKRILFLYKQFLKWSKELVSNKDQEEPSKPPEEDITFRKMNSAVDQCFCMYKKSRTVCEMNKGEIHYYQTLQKKIEEDIAEANQRITECKQELQEAKQIRKHRQEYDTLANLIEEHPNRRDTLDQLDKVGEDVEAMELRRKQLEEKLELRKKQFHVLLLSLQELQALIERDDVESENGDDEGMLEPPEKAGSSREPSVKPESLSKSRETSLKPEAKSREASLKPEAMETN